MDAYSNHELNDYCLGVLDNLDKFIRDCETVHSAVVDQRSVFATEFQFLGPCVSLSAHWHYMDLEIYQCLLDLEVKIHIVARRLRPLIKTRHAENVRAVDVASVRSVMGAVKDAHAHLKMQQLSWQEEARRAVKDLLENITNLLRDLIYAVEGLIEAFSPVPPFEQIRELLKSSEPRYLLSSIRDLLQLLEKSSRVISLAERLHIGKAEEIATWEALELNKTKGFGKLKGRTTPLALLWAVEGLVTAGYDPITMLKAMKHNVMLHGVTATFLGALLELCELADPLLVLSALIGFFQNADDSVFVLRGLRAMMVHEGEQEVTQLVNDSLICAEREHKTSVRKQPLPDKEADFIASLWRKGVICLDNAGAD